MSVPVTSRFLLFLFLAWSFPLLKAHEQASAPTKEEALASLLTQIARSNIPAGGIEVEKSHDVERKYGAKHRQRVAGVSTSIGIQVNVKHRFKGIIRACQQKDQMNINVEEMKPINANHVEYKIALEPGPIILEGEYKGTYEHKLIGKNLLAETSFDAEVDARVVATFGLLWEHTPNSSVAYLVPRGSEDIKACLEEATPCIETNIDVKHTRFNMDFTDSLGDIVGAIFGDKARRSMQDDLNELAQGILESALRDAEKDLAKEMGKELLKDQDTDVIRIRTLLGVPIGVEAG